MCLCVLYGGSLPTSVRTTGLNRSNRLVSRRIRTLTSSAALGLMSMPDGLIGPVRIARCWPDLAIRPLGHSPSAPKPPCLRQVIVITPHEKARELHQELIAWRRATNAVEPREPNPYDAARPRRQR